MHWFPDLSGLFFNYRTSWSLFIQWRRGGGLLFSCHKSTADLKIGWLRCSWIFFTYWKCSSVLFVAGHCTFQEVVDWKHSLHTAHLLGENGSKLVSQSTNHFQSRLSQHCLKPFKFSKHQYHCEIYTFSTVTEQVALSTTFDFQQRVLRSANHDLISNSFAYWSW
jgi:hypothetical protein